MARTGVTLKMTLIRYLLEYTIEHICKGNKSECARRLGLEYTELRRFRKRLSEGSGSNRIAELLLDMYWREELSIDEALKEYGATGKGVDIEKADRACREIVESVHKDMESNLREGQKVCRLLNAAHAFALQMERSFCQGTCRRREYEGRECPLQMYVAFWVKLQQEIVVRDDV